MNWGRNTLAMIPMVWLGATVFGAPGVLIGQAVSALLFGCIAWWLAHRLIAQGGRDDEKPEFARDGRILALFNHRR